MLGFRGFYGHVRVSHCRKKRGYLLNLMPIYAAKLHSKVACAKLLTLVVSSRNLIIDLCEYDITSLFRKKFRSLPLSGKFLKHKIDPLRLSTLPLCFRILLISFPPPSSILASRNRGQSECRPRSPSHRPNNFGSGSVASGRRIECRLRQRFCRNIGVDATQPHFQMTEREAAMFPF